MQLNLMGWTVSITCYIVLATRITVYHHCLTSFRILSIIYVHSYSHLSNRPHVQLPVLSVTHLAALIADHISRDLNYRSRIMVLGSEISYSDGWIIICHTEQKPLHTMLLIRGKPFTYVTLIII